MLQTRVPLPFPYQPRNPRLHVLHLRLQLGVGGLLQFCELVVMLDCAHAPQTEVLAASTPIPAADFELRTGHFEFGMTRFDIDMGHFKHRIDDPEVHMSHFELEIDFSEHRMK